MPAAHNFSFQHTGSSRNVQPKITSKHQRRGITHTKSLKQKGVEKRNFEGGFFWRRHPKKVEGRRESCGGKGKKNGRFLLVKVHVVDRREQTKRERCLNSVDQRGPERAPSGVFITGGSKMLQGENDDLNSIGG